MIGKCLNCGQEISKCKCLEEDKIETKKTEEEMLTELKKDIGRLRLKMLVKETEYRATEKIDIDGAIKDMTETRRKQELRDIRNILKEKLITFHIYQDAKAISKPQGVIDD